MLVARSVLAVTHIMRQQLHCRRQMTRLDKRWRQSADLTSPAALVQTPTPNPATGTEKANQDAFQTKSWTGSAI